MKSNSVVSDRLILKNKSKSSLFGHNPKNPLLLCCASPIEMKERVKTGTRGGKIILCWEWNQMKSQSIPGSAHRKWHYLEREMVPPLGSNRITACSLSFSCIFSGQPRMNNVGKWCCPKLCEQKLCFTYCCTHVLQYQLYTDAFKWLHGGMCTQSHSVHSV